MYRAVKPVGDQLAGTMAVDLSDPLPPPLPPEPPEPPLPPLPEGADSLGSLVDGSEPEALSDTLWETISEPLGLPLDPLPELWLGLDPPEPDEDGEEDCDDEPDELDEELDDEEEDELDEDEDDPQQLPLPKVIATQGAPAPLDPLDPLPIPVPGDAKTWEPAGM